MQHAPRQPPSIGGIVNLENTDVTNGGRMPGISTYPMQLLFGGTPLMLSS